MEVYIIRHGQSTNNALMENQHLRVEEPPLTDVGHQQAVHLAEFLRDAHNLEDVVRQGVDSEQRETFMPHTLTHLYCSPMLRAMQTAQPIAAALGVKPAVWVSLHEHGGVFKEHEGEVHGFPGMTRTQILEQFPDYVLPDNVTEAGWWDASQGMEHITGTYARASRVALDLRARAQSPETAGDKVALVAHGMFIDSLIKAFLHNLPSDRYFHWHYNTAVSRVDLVEGGVVVIRYVNRVTHLPVDLVT